MTFLNGNGLFAMQLYRPQLWRSPTVASSSWTHQEPIVGYLRRIVIEPELICQALIGSARVFSLRPNKSPSPAKTAHTLCVLTSVFFSNLEQVATVMIYLLVTVALDACFCQTLFHVGYSGPMRLFWLLQTGLRVAPFPNRFGHYWTKLTPVISEGTFLASPAGAGVQGVSPPLSGSRDTT